MSTKSYVFAAAALLATTLVACELIFPASDLDDGVDATKPHTDAGDAAHESGRSHDAKGTDVNPRECHCDSGACCETDFYCSRGNNMCTECVGSGAICTVGTAGNCCAPLSCSTTTRRCTGD